MGVEGGMIQIFSSSAWGCLRNRSVCFSKQLQSTEVFPPISAPLGRSGSQDWNRFLQVWQFPPPDLIGLMAEKLRIFQGVGVLMVDDRPDFLRLSRGGAWWGNSFWHLLHGRKYWERRLWPPRTQIAFTSWVSERALWDTLRNSSTKNGPSP